MKWGGGLRLVRDAWHHLWVTEQQLDGGNTAGATRVGDTVRRPAGPWTKSVHDLLTHLAGKGFGGAPRPLGVDGEGREVLTFLEGETVGSAMPWPAWAHADGTLGQVARWLRAYHRAVADFVPGPDAVWRGGGRWSPGLIIGHNDAAPYNAAWCGGELGGFFDWDYAGPVTPEGDLAFVAFSWVPLHARNVVAAEGFTDFAARPRRLRLFLDAYGWSGSAATFIEEVRTRADANAQGIRRQAAGGDPLSARLLRQGVAADLDRAIGELADFRF